jgi:hypothetical protein
MRLMKMFVPTSILCNESFGLTTEADKTMRTSILIWITLLPCIAFGATDCRTVEYPDHFEAVCDGETGYVPPQSQVQDSPAARADFNPVNEAKATRSQRAGKLDIIHELGARRYNPAPAASAVPDKPESVK